MKICFLAMRFLTSNPASGSCNQKMISNVPSTSKISSAGVITFLSFVTFQPGDGMLRSLLRDKRNRLELRTSELHNCRAILGARGFTGV